MMCADTYFVSSSYKSECLDLTDVITYHFEFPTYELDVDDKEQNQITKSTQFNFFFGSKACK